MNKPSSIIKLILDPDAPPRLRARILMQTMQAHESAEQIAHQVVTSIEGSPRDDAAESVRKLLEELRSGPLRCATFLRFLPGGNGVRRAQILFPEGGSASCVVPDAETAELLRPGDTVWMDGGAKAVLHRESEVVGIGEEGRLERRLDAERVEVQLRDQGRFVFHCAERLREQLEAGEAEPGAKVLVCPSRMIAFSAVPRPDAYAHYEFLDTRPVPDVIVERDIGSPPRFIATLTRHLRTELEQPELGRDYRVRPSRMVLLTGVTGAGKTLSILGFIRRAHEVMSEATGIPLADLPPRVVRLESGAVLSKWFGESEQRLERFFNEVEELADKEFPTPDGRSVRLPLIVVCEEIDGIARARGSDPIYDRIQTTLLRRFDSTSQSFRNRMVMFLCTTNVPHMVDEAFFRRAGGAVERFGRLDPDAFMEVLGRHVREIPFRAGDGNGDGARERVLADVSDWLFSANGDDPGQVEFRLVGASEPLLKYRRDFLTAGLVDRAVQQAASEARDLQAEDPTVRGVTAGLLMRALHDQIRSVVALINTENAGGHVTLPDGVRVAGVRRIDQAPLLPVELERVPR